MKKPMTNYPWAANVFKFQRAVAAVGTEDEAALKAEYVKMGGLLIGDSEPTVATVVADEPVTVSEPVFAEKTDEAEAVEAAEEPKKASAKKAAKKTTKK